MTTVTGLTAERMLAIEGASVVDGEIISGNLILTKHDGTTINAGSVAGPQGPAGPPGPASISAIPGEIKLWPGGALPEASYGKWVWADGAVYPVATYPIAASHIYTNWRTFGGASDPGPANFRVPDLRGLVPAGMDAMPGGGRANRMTRAVAINLAGRAGEETHIVTVNEMPAHAHSVNDPGHGHQVYISGEAPSGSLGVFGANTEGYAPVIGNPPIEVRGTGISINNNGGNGAHENVQPTVFVPYIVKLDD
jgi:microcystin-dependent protein